MICVCLFIQGTGEYCRGATWERYQQEDSSQYVGRGKHGTYTQQVKVIVAWNWKSYYLAHN